MWKPDPDKNRWYKRWAVTAWIALWTVVPGWAYALPSGGEIVSGSGAIEHTAQELTVQQDSQRLIPNGQDFSIGSAATLDFNGAPGAVITSARDIDVTAPNINPDENSFSETRNLILNGNVVGGGPAPGPAPVLLDTDSLQQGSLGTFLTDFLKNGGPSC